MNLISLVRSSYGLFAKIASYLQSPLLLIIRAYWGWHFVVTGWGKLTNLGKVTEFFTSLGIPMPGVNAFMAGSVECFGGALLLIGLASRAAALGLTFTMIVAYLTAEKEAVHAIFHTPDAFFSPDKFFAADPFLFLYASLIVLAFGPGLFSIDYILSRRYGHNQIRPATI